MCINDIRYDPMDIMGCIFYRLSSTYGTISYSIDISRSKIRRNMIRRGYNNIDVGKFQNFQKTSGWTLGCLSVVFWRIMIAVLNIVLDSMAITVASLWARWRLESPASRLFVQPFVQVRIKVTSKAPRHWPFWGESIHKGQLTRKMFPFDEDILQRMFTPAFSGIRLPPQSISFESDSFLDGDRFSWHSVLVTDSRKNSVTKQ